MGLFRVAVVSAIVISLLPSDREQQDKLYERAANAAHWTMTFCDRNAATCAQAASLWDQFTAKAEFGARLAYDMLREAQTESQTEAQLDSATAGAAGRQQPGLPLDSRGTLRPEDLKPAWRAPATQLGSL
jgi:hypothetical protein